MNVQHIHSLQVEIVMIVMNHVQSVPTHPHVQSVLQINFSLMADVFMNVQKILIYQMVNAFSVIHHAKHATETQVLLAFHAMMEVTCMQDNASQIVQHTIFQTTKCARDAQTTVENVLKPNQNAPLVLMITSSMITHVTQNAHHIHLLHKLSVSTVL